MGFYSSLFFTIIQALLLLGDLAGMWQLRWFWLLSPIIALFTLNFCIAFAHGFARGFARGRRENKK